MPAHTLRKLWESSSPPPDIFAFIERHDGHDPAALLALLQIDQQFRWKTDQPLRVEDYLARLPQLADDPRIKLELAVSELRESCDRMDGGCSTYMAICMNGARTGMEAGRLGRRIRSMTIPARTGCSGAVAGRAWRSAAVRAPVPGPGRRPARATWDSGSP